MSTPIGLPIARSRRERRSPLADLTTANVAAGFTASLFYAFGAIPIFLDATASLGLSPDAAASWFFIIFLTSAVSSLILTLRFRLPLPIGWTMPGLVFLAGTGHRYSHAEIAGACLVAGLLIVALGLLGVGERLLRWLPFPIVMGMFAGNVLGYVTGLFAGLETEPWVVGGAIAGYLGARGLGRAWLPPMAGAVLAGIAAAALAGQVQPDAFRWRPPVAVLVRPAFDPGALAALSLPLVVLAVGIGNVQGFGILAAQGYRPPVTLLTTWMGATTLLNAAFGGHPSAIQNNGAAVLAGPEAGPREGRYVANVIASLFALLLAACAAAAGTLLGVLPPALVPTLAGLALISTLIDALHKATVTDLPLGSFFALAIAASPLTIGGIGAALWAVLGGLLVSLLLERPALLRTWRANPPAAPKPDPPTAPILTISSRQPAGRRAMAPS